MRPALHAQAQVDVYFYLLPGFSKRRIRVALSQLGKSTKRKSIHTQLLKINSLKIPQHSEIHGGLDGWIEQRCPLARYGCSYARRRMHPGPNSRVIYSATVQSFGVVPLPDEHPLAGSNERDGALQLSDLPFEILRTIAGHLDSFRYFSLNIVFFFNRFKFLFFFSICHLALTSRLFRDVARSLLHHRGLVNVQWQKTRLGWRITQYVSN